MLGVHITFGVTVGLIMILAAFLCTGKGTILIGSMMLLPKEARDRVNKKMLGRFVSLILCITGFFTVLIWLDIAWLETAGYWLTWAAMGLMLVVLVVFVVLGLKNREKWFGLQK